MFELHGDLSAQCFVRAPATANTSFANTFWELQRLDKYAERCLVTQATAQRRRLMNSVRDSNFFGSVAAFPSPLDAGEPAMCTQKKLIWFGAMALVAGGSLVANMCAIHETSVLSATLNDRVLGFLPTRTRQAPGMERPRAGLASKFYTSIARVLGFLLSFNKKKN